MPKGDGKYDKKAEALVDEFGASAAFVMVVGGSRGNGVSICANLDTMILLPELLRSMASQIDADIAMELAERSN